MYVASTELRELTRAERELLGPDEQQKTYASDYRRTQFECGRALLRLTLQHATGKCASAHQISIEEGGKPYCQGGEAVSIAHTDNAIVCVVAPDGLAGIDIERVDEDRDVREISKRFFSVEENAWIAAGAIERFYMLWVLKEAFVKAHGRSIFGGLEKLRCTVDPPKINAEAYEGSFRDLGLYAHGDMFLALATTTASLDDARLFSWLPESQALIEKSDYTLVATT